MHKHAVTIVFLLLAVLAVPPAWSQTTSLCKWVDEKGTVHYDVECPEGVKADSVTVDTDPGGQGDDPYASSRQRAASAASAAQNSAATVPVQGGQDFSGMSPAQLRAACEQARQARLKPERDALIAECKAKGDRDPGFCERYYRDYGEGGMRGGRRVQPMYSNLPECVAARQAGG